jgi:hypothetical protein
MADETTKCASCGIDADADRDLCAGCNRIVCLDCVGRGGHELDGKHELCGPAPEVETEKRHRFYVRIPASVTLTVYAKNRRDALATAEEWQGHAHGWEQAAEIDDPAECFEPDEPRNARIAAAVVDVEVNAQPATPRIVCDDPKDIDDEDQGDEEEARDDG